MTNTPGTEPTPVPTPDATQPLPAATAGEQAPAQPSAHPTGHPTQPLPPHPVQHLTTPQPAPTGHATAPAGHTPATPPANPYARPAQGAPGAHTPSGSFGPPPAPPAPATAGESGAPQRRRTWVPVVSAAAAAALLASVGTAGLTGAFGADQDSASLADVGQQHETSAAPVADSSSQNPDWEAVTKAVAPSVVAIQVQTPQGGAEGSGVIIDDKGHVVTNNHVVSGAENDTVQVTLSDGRLFDAKIVGLDPATDLAVVQLVDAPDDLQPATLGDSDDVTVGESVLAVGNPLGLANTATTGIVSAVDRPVSASGEGGGTSVVTNAIQIDAAINPGNSGGPLFDAQGRVIGITSSIATLSSGGGQSGSIGLGFAIPVNLAKTIGQQLVDNGTAEHAFLGVTLADATATADGVTRRGAEVQEVTDGSPAADAGIRSGDVIVAIDGHPVGGAESLTAFVRERAAGAESKLTVVRDGKTLELDVTLATRPADDETTGQGSQDGQGQTPGQDGQGQLPGQGDQGDQGGQQGDQGQQGDPTDPGNVPNPFDWFFGGQG
ncbi:trypsin-like serine protease [Cellulosimicrobium terreum]|uniref:Trypsin-like serine protease n=2 Tax=Cellulosimicrobium funkei TaxID=264251 RepID=A0A4Y8R0N5_9MICO|nr:trypsin-like peptidase domain-containing protein [Cellulosimicrobium funkei]TFF07745.1 trypsin-like serine protease [Cellulosimicrobium funkei]TGA71231.1 trypsin-like serine protease [Cellulosimicrobium terreum]